MESSSLWVMLVVGFLGTGHCIGMCGGVISTLSVSVAVESKRIWLIHLAYHLGRVTSYTVMGIFVGAAGDWLFSALGLRTALFILAQVVMLALGLYIMGYTKSLAWIEKVGYRLWKHIRPGIRFFMPVRSISQALPLGMLWGWLPCGLVYTALVSALSSGSAMQGGLMMLAFGVGTLPSLLIAGLFLSRLRHYFQKKWIRLMAGLMIMAYAIHHLYVFFSHGLMRHH